MSKVQDTKEPEFKVPDVTNLKVSEKTEQPKVKTILFCVPGKEFSSRFYYLGAI